MPLVLIQSFRPTLQVDGNDQTALSDALDELLIVEDTDGLYRCEVRVTNWGGNEGAPGFLWFGSDLPGLGSGFGKSLTVKIHDQTWFEGRITALEASYPDARPPELRILAEDRLQELRQTRRTRSFADVGISDLVSAIANDHGLTPDVDLTSPTWKQVAQANQSDLAFLRERVRRLGGEIRVSGTTLKVAKRSTGGTTISLAYGAGLREFSVIADLAHQRTAVAVNGWDRSGKQAVTHEAGADVVSSELDGGRSGPAVMQDAFGERKEAIAHLLPPTTESAQALAEAHQRGIARRFVIGRGVAEPNPELRVGAVVDLAQLGPLFNGKYYVTEVRHGFDLSHGLRTEFTAERPGLGQPGGGA